MTRTGDKFLTVKDWFADKVAEELSRKIDMCDVFAILKETDAALAENADGTALLNGLVHKFPDSKIVLTLGKEGSMYGYHTKRCAQGIFPVKTVDTTAAGDTFTGYFIGEIINGKTPEEALKTAAMASAIAVGKKGASTSIPTIAEVRDSL